MQGTEIKIELLKRHLTQRWLLQQLHHRGFGKLHEPHFSDILNGVYTAGDAPDIIAAAEKVLDDQQKSA
jgi:hypothetical protein